MVSDLAMDLLMEIGVLSFVLPVGVLLAWRIRTHKSFKPAIAGVLTFLFFLFLFKRIPDTIFLSMKNPVSTVLNANGFLAGLYLGLAAAVFEETGRYLVFKYVLNKDTERFTAITYGIGHGGLEWILTLGITDLSYFTFATIYNDHADKITDKSFLELIKTLTVENLILDGFKQIFFFGIQICLSVMILEAYRNEAERKRYFLIALVTHFLAYLPIALYSGNMIGNRLATVFLAAITVFSVLYAKEIYQGIKKNDEKTDHKEKKKEEEEKKKGFAYAAKKLK